MGGERGVARFAREPLWENPATPNYSQLVSLAGLFVFHMSSLRQAWLGHLKNKNPAAGCGSNLALRREGGSNPRSRVSGTTVFETAAFDHSAISPISADLRVISRIHHGVYPAKRTSFQTA